MAIISFQLDDDTAARFTALANQHGGKSALLRQLVSLVLKDGPVTPTIPEPKGRLVQVRTRLTVAEERAMREAAAARKMKPSQWLRSLIRVRLGAGTQYSPDELQVLRTMAVEVSRIGVNLNQLSRAVNRAIKRKELLAIDRKPIDSARTVVAKVRSEIAAQAKGHIRYWEAGAK